VWGIKLPQHTGNTQSMIQRQNNAGKKIKGNRKSLELINSHLPHNTLWGIFVISVCIWIAAVGPVVNRSTQLKVDFNISSFKLIEGWILGPLIDT
jgi:hypothetical protein